MSNNRGTRITDEQSVPVAYNFDDALLDKIRQREDDSKVLYKKGNGGPAMFTIYQDEIVCMLKDKPCRMLQMYRDSGIYESNGRPVGISVLNGIPTMNDPKSTYASNITNPALIFDLHRNDLLSQFTYLGIALDLSNQQEGDAKAPTHTGLRFSATGQHMVTVRRVRANEPLRSFQPIYLGLPCKTSEDGILDPNSDRHGSRVRFTYQHFRPQDATTHVVSNLLKEQFYFNNIKGTVSDKALYNQLKYMENDFMLGQQFMSGVLGLFHIVLKVFAQVSTAYAPSSRHNSDLFITAAAGLPTAFHYNEKTPSANAKEDTDLQDVFEGFRPFLAAGICKMLIASIDKPELFATDYARMGLQAITQTISSNLDTYQIYAGRTLMVQSRDNGQPMDVDKVDIMQSI